MLKIFSEIKEQIISFDVAILKFINIKLYNEYIAKIIKFASNDIFLLIVVFSGLVVFFLRKKIKYADKINLMLALWGLILVNLTNTFILKPIFKRPRPSAVFSDVILLAELKKLGYAFPSTHSAMFTFFVLILWKDYTDIRTFLILLLLSICFFCVYTGGHYPSDVIAGVILGWIFFIIFDKFKKILLNTENKKSEKQN